MARLQGARFASPTEEPGSGEALGLRDVPAECFRSPGPHQAVCDTVWPMVRPAAAWKDYRPRAATWAVSRASVTDAVMRHCGES